MTRPSDGQLFDQRIADWLEDDPTVAPPQLLETVRAAAPSIAQRRPAVRWRLGSGPAVLRFAAIAAALLFVAILGGAIIKLPSVGPSTVPSGLTNRVNVPLHFYSIALPAGWGVTLATGTGRPDSYLGPEGTLTATFALIPTGTGQDAWADSEFMRQMARRGGACIGIDPGTFQDVRAGAQDALFYALPCKPELMALTALGDRAFIFEFSTSNGVSTDAATRLFKDILLGLTFDQGSTPAIALSTFTSTRYGFSIGYPTAWAVTESADSLAAFDIPWANGTSVDIVEGSGVGEPGQPSDGTLDLAATTVPPGTTVDELISRTAQLACGAPDSIEDVIVDGKPGKLLTYRVCKDVFHQWVVLLDGTRAYHLLWLNYVGTEGFDRTVFEDILRTVRLTGSPASTSSPIASPVGDPIPDTLIGAWSHPAPGWWWFLRAGDPECVQALRTQADCIVWQRGTTPKEIGIATMSGGDLKVAWKSGFCTSITSTYSVALNGDSLNLVDIGGGCEGGNFALTRAGTGTAPTAPPPPTP